MLYVKGISIKLEKSFPKRECDSYQVPQGSQSQVCTESGGAEQVRWEVPGGGGLGAIAMGLFTPLNPQVPTGQHRVLETNGPGMNSNPQLLSS